MTSHCHKKFRWLFGMVLLFSAVGLAQQPNDVVRFTGHTEAVYAVTVSQDGKQAATVSFDQTIRFWSPTDAKLYRTIGGKGGHTSQILAVTMSPDGQRLVTSGADNQARLWEVPALTPNWEKPLNPAQPLLATSPNNEFVATAGDEGMISTWKADGEPLKNWKAGDTPLIGLGISPNSQNVVTLSNDNTLSYSNAGEAKLLTSVGVSRDKVSDFLVAPGNGSSIVTTEAGQLSVWPSQPPQQAAELPDLPQDAVSTVISADGNQLAVVCADRHVRVKNLGNGQDIHTLGQTAAPITSFSLYGNNGPYAAGCDDGQVYFWDQGGKLVGNFKPEPSPVVTVDYHSGKTELLVTHQNGVTKVWRTPGKPEELQEGQPAFECINSLPDVKAAWARWQAGDRIFLCLQDQQLQIRGFGENPEVQELGRLPRPAAVTTISRDGNIIVVGCGPELLAWTMPEGKPLPCPKFEQEIRSLDLSLDKNDLVIGFADGSATQMSFHETYKDNPIVQHAKVDGPAVGVALKANPPSMYVVSANRKIAISGLARPKLATDPARIGKAVCTDAGGGSIYTAGTGTEISVWQTGDANMARAFPAIGPVRAMTLSRNNQWLAVAAEKPKVIALYRPNDGYLFGQFEIEAEVDRLLFHPNRPILYGIAADNRVLGWQVTLENNAPLAGEFGRSLDEFAQPEPITAVATFDNPPRLYTNTGKQFAEWRLAQEQQVRNFGHPTIVSSVSFDPKGEKLATGCHDGNLRIWDVEKGNAIRTIAAYTQPQQSPIYSAVWSKDGNRLYSSSFEGSIKAWDANNGNMLWEIEPAPQIIPPPPVIREAMPLLIGSVGTGLLNKPQLPGHSDQVFSLAVDPEGKLLASGSSDRQVKIWNAETGELVHILANPDLNPAFEGEERPSHPGFVHAVAFTPDGKKLLSGGTGPGGQGYLAVWSVADGKRIAGQTVPYGPINGLTIDPEGQFVILACGPKSRMVSEADAVRIPIP